MSSRRRPDDDGIERAAADAFERAVDRVDGPVRARLAQARGRALAAYDARAAVSWPLVLRVAAPVGALAAAALAAWLVMLPRAAEEAPLGVADAADLEILLGEEDLELYEDLEFYAWLEEQGVVEAPPAADGDDVG